MTSESPPPTSRYDRQLRLWGDVGQRKLARARIAAIGVTPSTMECMKCLVLGGCESFVIIDDGARVDARLAGELFEVSVDDVDGALSAAEVCVRALCALNPDARGRALRASRDTLFVARDDETPEAFADVDVVIAGGLSDAESVALERACANGLTPFVITRACGLFGETRTGALERWATENVTPEGSQTSDLRLMTPWEQLSSYAEMKTCDLERLDAAAFKHVPFVALLLRATMRSGTRDRRAVKEALTSMRRGMDEENFDEAMANVRYTWTDTGAVPKEVDDVTREAAEMKNAGKLTLESDKFWFLALALREFIDREGCLPLEGSIPDMTSTTEAYVELQRLYADKAASDALTVWQRALELAQEVGFLQPEDFITERDAKSFCKNSRYVRFMKWKSLDTELYGTTGAAVDALAVDAKDPTKAMSVAIFGVLRAADVFAFKHGHRPGVYNDMSSTMDVCDENERLHADGEELVSLTTTWFTSRGVEAPECVADVAHEVARYGDGQLHAVGAILGGIASQEIIKIITQQYTPMTKRLIYDGVHSTTAYVG